MRLAQCDHEDGIGYPNCLAISTVSTVAHAMSMATPVSVERAPKRRPDETLIRALR